MSLQRKAPKGISKKDIGKLNLFWAGFTIYTIAYALSTDVDFILGPTQMQAIQLVGLLLVILGAARYMKFRFDEKYVKTVFIILFIFSLTVIARGFKTDYAFIKKMLFNPYYGMLHYFVPLVLLLPKDIKHYKIIFNVLTIFIFFVIAYILFYVNVLFDWRWDNDFAKMQSELIYQYFTLPAGFLLMTFFYHSNKKKWLVFIVSLITLYFLIHRARRGSLFMESLTLISAGLIYLIYTKRKALIIGLLIFLVPVIFIYTSGVKLPAMFDFLMARGSEDTRTPVEQYMSVSMSKFDWLFGKGINGSYFCPVVRNMETGDFTRDVIETGYLQIILKGGYVSLILLLLILVPAVYFGFSKSNNVLTKGAAMLILLWLLSLRPTVGNGFTMQYLLVWISVGICYSRKIRNLSDIEIKKLLQA